MKNNNFLLALALSIGFSSPISLNAAQQPMGWSDWAWQKAAAAQSYAASWVPQSVKNTVNSWSMPKKETVLKAILVSLVAAGIYSQKDTIGDILSGTVDKLRQYTPNMSSYAANAQKNLRQLTPNHLAYVAGAYVTAEGSQLLHSYITRYNNQYAAIENLIQPDKTFNKDELNEFIVETFCRYGIPGLEQLRTIIEDLHKHDKLLNLPQNTIAITNAIANYRAQPFTCRQFEETMNPKAKGG